VNAKDTLNKAYVEALFLIRERVGLDLSDPVHEPWIRMVIAAAAPTIEAECIKWLQAGMPDG
jgi:hypothetical protein